MNFEYPSTESASKQGRLDTFLGMGVIWFLWFANLYDMGGGFGIKYVSFAVALLYVVLNFRPLPLDRTTTYLFVLVFLLWPVVSLLRGVLAGAEAGLAVSQITPFFAAGIYFLASQSVSPGRAASAFFTIMYSMAILVLAMYGLLWFNLPPGEYLLSLFSSAEHGYFGYRPLGETVLPNIYFKATLFFVPTYVYFLYMAKPVKALLVLVALALAFSKAGFAICLLFTLGYLFFHKAERRFKAAVLVACALLTPILYAFQVFMTELAQSIAGQTETVQVRLSYIDSLRSLFGESPSLLLLGQGAGVSFYSRYLGEFVSNMEVDYLNVIRKFGLPWFMAFTAFVLVLSGKLFRSGSSESSIIGLALLAEFLAAGTNPVLLSPPSLMFLVMALDYHRRAHEFVC